MKKRIRMKRYIGDPEVELNKARYNHKTVVIEEVHVCVVDT